METLIHKPTIGPDSLPIFEVILDRIFDWGQISGPILIPGLALALEPTLTFVLAPGLDLIQTVDLGPISGSVSISGLVLIYRRLPTLDLVPILDRLPTVDRGLRPPE
jgi:hypothetical protein